MNQTAEIPTPGILTTELSLRNLFKLLVDQWKHNPLVPLAQNLALKHFLFLIIFVAVFEREWMKPVGYEFQSTSHGYFGRYLYQEFARQNHFLPALAIIWIVHRTSQRLRSRQDLLQLPLTRTDWILGPMLPTLFVATMCAVILNAEAIILRCIAAVWDWTSHALPKGNPTAAFEFSYYPLAFEFAAILRAPLDVVVGALAIILILLRTTLFTKPGEKLGADPWFYILVPPFCIVLWANFLGVFAEALAAEFAPLSNGASWPDTVTRIYVKPLVLEVAKAAIYFAGSLWIFRFFLRRDLPRIGKTFPATE